MIDDMLYKDECYKINGCVFEVYKQLGSGFLEAVYQEALEYQLNKEGIPFEAQKTIQIYYDGLPLRQFYKADIICFDKILIELKSVSTITNEHKAQLFNYLKATKLELGLLVNFGSYPKVEIQRMIYQTAKNTKGRENK
jgi:GxxExxY protein